MPDFWEEMQMRYRVGTFFIIVLLAGGAVSYAQSAAGDPPNDRLFAHIYGAVAGAYIGNAMGAPVEGWTWERIEKTYGFLDKFVADSRSRGVPNQPGWTEDGMERYKLMCSAIIKKGGRISIEELAREWVESIDPTKIGFRIGPQDRIIYDLLKAGMPPYEVGRYAIWPGFMGTAKMMQPLGLISACRPDVAAKDALDLGRIKDSQGRPLWRDDKQTEDGRFRSTLVYNNALENCAAIAAATAEAIRPNATVDSVIATALAQLPPGSRKEVETVLGFAKNAKDWKEIRPLYQKFYEGRPVSNAIDILAGGLACFKLANGQPREATLYATNLGRDTDCKAYVAGGLAGALRGIQAWPREWVELVEKAVVTDPYTVDKRTARQIAEGLYKACRNELRKVRSQTDELESLLVK
jgi:ADP-ribosylglycohydrolase